MLHSAFACATLELMRKSHWPAHQFTFGLSGQVNIDLTFSILGILGSLLFIVTKLINIYIIVREKGYYPPLYTSFDLLHRLYL